MKYIYILMMQVIVLQLSAQNCEAFKLYGDTLQYEACTIAEEANNHYQFSKEYQQIYDQSIEKCNYFASAYHAKSVAYLKSGDFVEWKKLIDKAVELDPKEYLGYRAWCRFQFCRDYKGAIKDIERLDTLVNYDIGYSSDGEYHLDIARAVCYKKIGQNQKAIKIIETKHKETNYDSGLYDYFHLGVLYLEEDKNNQAISALEKQNLINENAENYYYLAIAYKQLKNRPEYNQLLQKSKELYTKGSNMINGYTTHIDKIFLNDIAQEIEKGF